MNIEKTNKINAQLAKFNKLPVKRRNFIIEYCKDFSARRAAEASGFAADTGYSLLKEHEVEAAIDEILESRLESSDIDAEWALMQAVDNALIAKQQGNISASNTALGLVMKHTMVDAMASDKINVNIHANEQLLSKLQRGRLRNADTDDTESTPTNVVSFF